MTAINWRRPRKRFTCWVSTKASCKSRAMKVGVFKEGFTRGRMEVTCCFLNLRCVLFSQCLPRILCCFITFLCASKHVSKRLCPSVGWLLSHSFYDPHGARFVLFGLVWRLLDNHLFPSPSTHISLCPSYFFHSIVISSRSMRWFSLYNFLSQLLAKCSQLLLSALLLFSFD